MPRGRGALEERLRTWVRKRVENERGAKTALAAAIKKPRPWVSGYLDGTRHPNLDVTVAIINHYELRLDQVTGVRPLPEPDAATQRLMAAWKVSAPTNRALVLQTLMSLLTPDQREALRAEVEGAGFGALAITTRASRKKPAHGR